MHTFIYIVSTDNIVADGDNAQQLSPKAPIIKKIKYLIEY